jgi:putative FmdB family regulatory protein
MPLYDLKCENCQYIFEVLLKIQDENPSCPKCNGITQKLISRFFGVVPGSENRTLDCIVGHDSEKRWAAIEQRKIERKHNGIQKRILKEKT